MKLCYLAFTEKGKHLADALAEKLGGEAMRCGAPLSLDAFTQKAFAEAGGAVYVGAVGIAVRAVAPYVTHKTKDPAVVVVDECGRYAVPLLSGHLGGANDLARALARACGAQAVITTATDANGVFAVDEWAKRQGFRIENPEGIKWVSSALLAGKTVRVQSDWLIAGSVPPGVEVVGPEESGRQGCGLDAAPFAAVPASFVPPAALATPVPLATPAAPAVSAAPAAKIRLTLRAKANDAAQKTLRLVPAAAVLGVGCKRGTPAEALEAAFAKLLSEAILSPLAVCAAASIDLKKDEPGLLAFCAAHGWPLSTYDAAQLARVPGRFSASAFVRGVTGVDNVCERSAVLASGGALLVKKQVCSGVTMALAVRPCRFDWRWRDV